MRIAESTLKLIKGDIIQEMDTIRKAGNLTNTIRLKLTGKIELIDELIERLKEK